MSANLPTVQAAHDYATQLGFDGGQEELVNFLAVQLSNDGKPFSQDEVLHGLLVAREYGLNPLTKQIHLARIRGRVQPVVGVDGWIAIANRNSSYKGITYEEHNDEKGEIKAVSATVTVKGREPMTVTERLSENRGNTDQWKQRPARMLRHRATIQALRYALGITGIMDPDEVAQANALEAKVEVIEPGKGAAAMRSQLGLPSRDVDEDLEERRGKAFAHFERLGVGEKDVLAYLGAESVSDVTSEQLASLAKVAQSIGEKKFEVKDVFPGAGVGEALAATKGSED